jgi:hypothetical protein
MLHGGVRTVLGILRLKHTGEESEVAHTLYAGWRTILSILRLKHKHTCEESQAEHTLHAEWRTFPGILRLIPSIRAKSCDALPRLT